jgi:hypothetical protein
MQAFINEAENMLNSATMGMGKMDFSSAPSGHTPSVIGTQEVYRWASCLKAFDATVTIYLASRLKGQ